VHTAATGQGVILFVIRRYFAAQDWCCIQPKTVLAKAADEKRDPLGFTGSTQHSGPCTNYRWLQQPGPLSLASETMEPLRLPEPAVKIGSAVIDDPRSPQDWACIT
jgi:hypothetical protein